MLTAGLVLVAVLIVALVILAAVLIVVLILVVILVLIVLILILIVHNISSVFFLRTDRYDSLPIYSGFILCLE